MCAAISMKKSKRLQRNHVALQLAVASSTAFRTVVRGSSKDFLTLLCALAISLATQQIKTTDLLPHLRKHKRFIHRVGNKRQSADELRELLLRNRRAYHILKPLLVRILGVDAQAATTENVA